MNEGEANPLVEEETTEAAQAVETEASGKGEPEPAQKAESEPENPLVEEPKNKPVEWTAEALGLSEDTLADEAVKGWIDYAKELGMTPEAAGKAVDYYTKIRENEWAEFEKTKREWEKASNEWLGPDAKQKIGTITRALERFDPDVVSEFRTIMSETAVGNHPAVVRVFYELAKAAVGGGFTQGKAASQKKPVKLTDLFYAKE